MEGGWQACLREVRRGNGVEEAADGGWCAGRWREGPVAHKLALSARLTGGQRKARDEAG